VDAAMNMFRGTIFHAGIDATTKYPEAVEVIREIRLKTMVDTLYGPQLFTGKADVVVVKRIENGTAYCKVIDYKTKKSIEHSLVSPDRKHQMQINMYAHLVEKELPAYLTNNYIGLNGEKAISLASVDVVVDEVEIVYLDMKKVRRFTSAGSLQVKGKRTSTSPLLYEYITLEPISLLPSDIVEDWVRTRIEEKINAKQVLPDILEGDAAWVCSFCSVKQVCMEIGNV
jgi:CRISPR/Cas system-associated exonuclease Cas4 (RecB family)